MVSEAYCVEKFMDQFSWNAAAMRPPVKLTRHEGCPCLNHSRSSNPNIKNNEAFFYNKRQYEFLPLPAFQGDFS